jgi:hypothetical protein
LEGEHGKVCSSNSTEPSHSDMTSATFRQGPRFRAHGSLVLAPVDRNAAVPVGTFDIEQGFLFGLDL